MKLNLVKDEMSLLIENMTEQFEMINQHETEIPQIELDIFMRNIQKLYENAIFLNNLNKHENPVEKVEINHSQTERNEKLDTESVIAGEENINEVKTETVFEEKVEAIIEEKIEINIEEQAEASAEENDEKPIPDLLSLTNDINLSKPKKELVEEQKEIQTHLKESKTEEKENLTDDSKKEAEASASFDDILEKESDQQEVDLFSSVKANSEIVDLNNKLAEARNTQSIVEKLQSKRIENLKAVIGVNDKFYFINELFGGNSQKYEDIIYTLNNFKKFEDAMVYFSTLKYKFSWDEESQAYQKLVLMLERKFDMTHA